MEQLVQENSREIDIYFEFAMQVFEENPQAGDYDFYAALNAAFWLRDSRLVTPEAFTVALVVKLSRDALSDRLRTSPGASPSPSGQLQAG